MAEELDEEAEEDEEAAVPKVIDGNANHGDNNDMEDGEEDEDENEKHAEHLTLPPHGFEVYVFDVPNDAFE